MGKKAYFSEDFYFDMGSNLLFYKQKLLPLSTVQRDLLALLIAKRDQLISDQELIDYCNVASDRLTLEIASIRKHFKKVFGDAIGKDFITRCRGNHQFSDGSYSLNSCSSIYTIKICDDENQVCSDDVVCHTKTKFDLITAELFYRRDDIQNEIKEIQLQMSQNPINIGDELAQKYLEKTQELASLNSKINSNKILYLQILKNSSSSNVGNGHYSDSIQKAKEFYELGQINEAINELRSNIWNFEDISNCNNAVDIDTFITRNKLLISFILTKDIKVKFFSIISINDHIKKLYEEILILVVQSHNNYDSVLDYALFLFKFKLIDESIIIFQKLENLYSLDNSILPEQWSELEYNWGKAYSLQSEASYDKNKALEHFKKAINYIIKNEDIEHHTIVHILSYIDISNVYLNEAQYTDSLFYAFKALTYLEAQDFSQDIHLNIWGQIYSLIGKSYKNIDCNKSINNLLRAVEFYEKSINSSIDSKTISLIGTEQLNLKEELAIVYSNLYNRYNDLLNFEKAEYYLTQSFEIKKELYKMNPYSYGITYGIACKYKADFYIQHQDFSLVRQELINSLLSKKYSLSADSNVHQFTISTTQLALANLDSIIGDFDAAHHNYSEVLECRKNMFKSPTPKNRERLFNVLYNIGFSYLIQTDKKELSLKYFSEALDLLSFNDLSISSGISPERYCQGLLSMARATRETGDNKSAQKFYHDAYSLCLYLESNTQYSVRLSTYIRAVAYYEIGSYLHFSSKSNALMLLHKSLELWEYLLSAKSEWYINDWILTAKAVYQLESDKLIKHELQEKISLYSSPNATYMTHQTLFYIF